MHFPLGRREEWLGRMEMLALPILGPLVLLWAFWALYFELVGIIIVIYIHFNLFLKKFKKKKQVLRDSE
jgi:hypothetical protein